MTVRRWVDAFLLCAIISALLLRRLQAKDSLLFCGALFIIYLTGYLAVQHIGRQKHSRMEAHVLNFATGIAISSFGWYGAMWLTLPVSLLTFITIEALILFVLANIIWLRSIKNG
jgi:hypothetical protein